MQHYDAIAAGNANGAVDTPPHDRALVRAMDAKFIPPNAESDHRITNIGKRTLFVGRLAPTVTQDILADTFRCHGTLIKTRIVVNIVTGQGRGYGFVEFADSRSADQAIRACNGMLLHQQRILVDTEHGRRVSGWVPRRLGGGLGGKRGSGQMRFGGIDAPFRVQRPQLMSTSRDISSSSNKRRSTDRIQPIEPDCQQLRLDESSEQYSRSHQMRPIHGRDTSTPHHHYDARRQYNNSERDHRNMTSSYREPLSNTHSSSTRYDPRERSSHQSRSR
ncbi:hypothetical protein BASA82_000849 [Batrachochytrium salamandrivorans]|nr:hypothetical protein BASA62_007910 [Batrachochytrium salamandrivorans]KAH6583351.1 hypothetical protein BASA61_008061 [Batrachochytrium salamandrivorans]KAH6583680.1 hypothetical protein BASA60_001325 [Batrachochytrium salamandrivorans]KAH6584349.1 hypothetical protein BASA61_007514 [Batrachochytrium salamandrivorans]KAH9257386.1 hypothetical protein BASA81_004544 [Batrachochytrium salamandrivorans]